MLTETQNVFSVLQVPILDPYNDILPGCKKVLRAVRIFIFKSTDFLPTDLSFMKPIKIPGNGQYPALHPALRRDGPILSSPSPPPKRLGAAPTHRPIPRRARTLRPRRTGRPPEHLQAAPPGRPVSRRQQDWLALEWPSRSYIDSNRLDSQRECRLLTQATEPSPFPFLICI